MSVNIKVTGGLNIEWGQIDPKVTGGLKKKGAIGKRFLGKVQCIKVLKNEEKLRRYLSKYTNRSWESKRLNVPYETSPCCGASHLQGGPWNLWRSFPSTAITFIRSRLNLLSANHRLPTDEYRRSSGEHGPFADRGLGGSRDVNMRLAYFSDLWATCNNNKTPFGCSTMARERQGARQAKYQPAYCYTDQTRFAWHQWTRWSAAPELRFMSPSLWNQCCGMGRPLEVGGWQLRPRNKSGQRAHESFALPGE